VYIPGMASGTQGTSKSITETAAKDRRKGSNVLIIFFAIFGLFGAAFFFGMFAPGMINIVRARTWTTTQCRILYSGVKEHPSGDDDGGETYSVEVRYTYFIDSKSYESNRYGFFNGSSSGRSAKQAIVAKLKPGTQTKCYVNPADHTQAVLNRDWTSDQWFAAIPGSFMLIGLIGVVGGLRMRRSRADEPMARGNLKAATPGVIATHAGDQPQVLTASSSKIGRLVGLLIFALIWNGIVLAIFGTVEIHGAMGWGVRLFAIPFLVVGLVLIGLTIRAFLALLNPVPKVTISRSALRPGESAELKWEFSGRYDRISSLSITLEGREEATYRRGTDTHTDRQPFRNTTLVETSKPMDIRAGKANLAIPAGAMHSFKSRNNAIVWELTVHGEIANWPDVKETFRLAILPAAAAKVVEPSPPGEQYADDGVTPIVLTTEGSRTAYQPGETLRGEVAFERELPTDFLEVRLFWYTRGKGTEDLTIVETARFDKPRRSQRYGFSFTLPDEPNSFSGQLISLMWAIEAVVKPSGESGRIELTVAPGGREINLGSASE
jgi:hypothetical protein